MPITIFHSETNAHEEWLVVEDDGTATYHIENSGWPMMRAGVNARERPMSASKAKAEWPSYAADIDAALAEIAERRR
jgi:hypothetical protein